MAKKVIIALLFLATLPGLFLVQFHTDPSALYKPDPVMVRGEAHFAQAPQDQVANRALIRKNFPDYPLSDDAPMMIDAKAELAKMFARMEKETYILIGASLAILLVVLALMKSLKLVVPIAASLLSTTGVLGYLGTPINFFQMLVSFVLVGLGLDYAIFAQKDSHVEVERWRKRVVFASFLTSFIGLGLLAFTSFAVTASMGVTFAIGLFFAYVYSLVQTN